VRLRSDQSRASGEPRASRITGATQVDRRLTGSKPQDNLMEHLETDFSCGLFRLVCTNGMVVSDGTFQRISIKHSGFNPDSVIEASFKVLTAVPDIMNKVRSFKTAF
jgi:hypothetical protein